MCKRKDLKHKQDVLFQLSCYPGNLSTRNEVIQMADEADKSEALWPE